MDFQQKIKQRFSRIYNDEDLPSRLSSRVIDLIEEYGFEMDESVRHSWTQKDIVLITYGDVISSNGHKDHKLKLLETFLEKYVGEAVNSLHILPFFPSSSDGGFSVIDYKKVREDLGDWSDIERLSCKYNLMADLVINHTSRSSWWFSNYRKGQKPGKEYFIEENPNTDLSAVTRPRNTPLLTPIDTDRGRRHVWTTFSGDQIDLDFSNPEVLFEFIDIFLFYLSKGIKIIRLDAIAYIWKEVGTKSIHLQETHQIVRLFRDLVDYIAPDQTLITETNVPFVENISYFGDGDEAHMVYQFSLPPLLLHALLTENGYYLTRWANELPTPPEGCTYFNFTASHDGIGVRPLEGLVPDSEFDYLIESTEERGGFVSYKKNSDGSESPYELNITYFDAFADPDSEDITLQCRRYLCSQIIMLSLQGVPGIYFHNLTATHNHKDGVEKTGIKREINRKTWNLHELEERLQNPNDSAHKIFNFYKKLLEIRRRHSAFQPKAAQEIFNVGDDYFALLRSSDEEGEQILLICNLKSKKNNLSASKLQDELDLPSKAQNLIAEGEENITSGFTFEPFEAKWIKL